MISLVFSLFLAQTPVFPGRAATPADLMVARNFVETRLAEQMDAVTTAMQVVDPTGIEPHMLLSVDNEIVAVAAKSGNTLTVLRAFDSTAAAAHRRGAPVRAYIAAWHHNALREEIQAIESYLLSTAPDGAVLSSNFDFPPVTPGGSLTGGSPATVTLSPCPQGVAGSNTNHYLYISGGTGTPESVLITGGTCVSGGPSGTITFTPANYHSGAWQIRSATAGIQEAAWASAATGAEILLPAGQVNVYGCATFPLLPYPKQFKLKGRGRSVTHIAASQIDPSAPCVLRAQGSTMPAGIALPRLAPTFSDFSIIFEQPWSMGRAAFTAYPTAIVGTDAYRGEIRNVLIVGAWNGIRLVSTGSGGTWQGNTDGWLIENVWMSAANIGVDIDGAFDTTRITGFHFWPFETGTTLSAYWIFDPAITGIRVHRADHVIVDNSLLYGRRTLVFEKGHDTFGVTLGQVSNVVFDGITEIVVDSSNVNFQNVHIYRLHSSGPAECRTATPAVHVKKSGLIAFQNGHYINYCRHPSSPFFQVNYDFAYSMFQLSGGNYADQSADANAPPMLLVDNGAAGAIPVFVDSVAIRMQPDINYAQPRVNVKGFALLNAQNNAFYLILSGSGVAFSVEENMPHVIAGNQLDKFTITKPATVTQGMYQPNSIYPNAALRESDFANLGTAVSAPVFCRDCGVVSATNNTCAGSGPGALAFGVGSTWRCFTAVGP